MQLALTWVMRYALVSTMDRIDIKTAREFLGESQAAFGARFDVDQSTVHRWETIAPPARGPARMAVDKVLADVARRLQQVQAAE